LKANIINNQGLSFTGCMYIMHIDKSRTNEFSSLNRSLCSAALDHR